MCFFFSTIWVKLGFIFGDFNNSGGADEFVSLLFGQKRRNEVPKSAVPRDAIFLATNLNGSKSSC